MSNFFITIVASLALCPAIGFAQTMSGQAISGAGTSTCIKYIEGASNRDLADLYITWMQGFLSGMNVANRMSTGEDLFVLPNTNNIRAYLDKYCRQNPNKSPMTAGMAMFHEIQKNK